MPSSEAWMGAAGTGRYLAWPRSFRKVRSPKGDERGMGMSWLFGRGNAPRAPVVVAMLVLLNALVLRVADPPGLVRLRDFAFDNYQRIKPRAVQDDLPVRIVDIDEASLAEYGQWPWRRSLIAELVDKLTADGAAVVAFDVVFAEADRSSLKELARQLP